MFRIFFSPSMVYVFQISAQFFKILLFIYFWLCWVCVAVWVFFQLQLVRATPELWCAGFSLWWLLLLQSTGSRAHGFQQLQHMGLVAVDPSLQGTGSVIEVHRLSSSIACGIFPDQGLNLCLLHWQVDSSPLSLQGSTQISALLKVKSLFSVLIGTKLYLKNS